MSAAASSPSSSSSSSISSLSHAVHHALFSAVHAPDVSCLASVLTKHKQQEITLMDQYFTQHYNQSLASALDSVSLSPFVRLAFLSCVLSPCVQDARALHRASQQDNQQEIEEILLCRTSNELKAIDATYASLYSCSLLSSLPHAQHAFYEQIGKANRTIDKHEQTVIEKAVAQLHEALHKVGCDHYSVIDLLSSNGGPALSALYERVFKEPLATRIELNIADAHIRHKCLMLCKPPQQILADALPRAGRSELIELLGPIKATLLPALNQHMVKEKKQTLKQWIEEHVPDAREEKFILIQIVENFTQPQ